MGARTRVKICGITRPVDAIAAVQCGADAIGLVFYPSSPRAIDLPTAQSIAQVLPPFVSVVALFVDAEERAVREVIEALPVALLQFHGRESAALCSAFGRPYIKAVAMGPDTDLERAAQEYRGARGLLLDSQRPGMPGGTGEVFDWMAVPSHLGVPVILAGGLDADNVGEAITRVRPYAVDVSSGVEAARGVKDPQRMAAFLAAVRRVDVQLS